MKQETLERRLELLKLEGEGFSKPEIVKELSMKKQCSTRLVYWDFQTKPTWQSQIQQLKNATLKVLNRHDQLYRNASFQYIHSKNEPRTALRAITEMRELNRDIFDMMQSRGDIPKIKEQSVISGELTIKISPKLIVDEDDSAKGK